MAKHRERKKRSEGEQTAQQRLYNLVVIGSSAGGIEALSTVLRTLDAGFPVPIVIAQHLDPSRPSHLVEILTRRSALPVRTVTDHEPLEPGTVFVVPADRHVEISDGHLRLLADTLPRPKPSINLLLSTAARAYGEGLIAVILTGTGSDGAAGAREVKEAGGTVVIENPETAAFSGMPASLAPTTVDLIANLEQIGPLLQHLLAGTDVAALPNPETSEAQDTRERSLQSLLAQVHERNGIDFSSYRRPTILRRLQRRMIATNVSDLSEYSRYLESHPDEYQRLTASFLIKVTEFFRDTEFFRVLREQVIPEIIAQARVHNNALRIWSAGCATGEEAYSLAILVAEALGEELDQFQVQIFATDLDNDAVAFARRGIYLRAALTGLPEEFIARYFVKLDGSYEVTKQLRGLVIFGQHDLGQRAPFPHIDLVLCRNVLIYFTKELQARALQLFAFALRDGGYLALGKAETVRPLDAYFVSTNGNLKLYRRQGERVLGPITRIGDFREIMPRLPTLGQRLQQRPPVQATQDIERSQLASMRLTPSAQRARTSGEWLGNIVLDLPLGVVVVDRRYDIQAINSTALRLLGIYTAAQGEDLIHLTQSLPRDALRLVIDTAFQRAHWTATPDEIGAAGDSGETPTGHRNSAEGVVTLETVLGERRHLHVSCYPYPALRPAEETAGEPARRAPGVEAVLILIDDVTSTVDELEDSAVAADGKQDMRQVHQTREQNEQQRSVDLIREENERFKAEITRIGEINRSLLAANQDLTDVVLELRRSNEDLLVGHEEAEANAEEVKTLNEEMQATNEELVTINEELEATVEELHTANSDLQARGRELQQSSEILAAERTASEVGRAQLEAILLSLGDAVLVVDQTGTAILTNAAYEEMFGAVNATFAAEDETGRPLPTSATPQQRAARGETFMMEFALTGEDGRRRWFEGHRTADSQRRRKTRWSRRHPRHYRTEHPAIPG